MLHDGTTTRQFRVFPSQTSSINLPGPTRDTLAIPKHRTVLKKAKPSHPSKCGLVISPQQFLHSLRLWLPLGSPALYCKVRKPPTTHPAPPIGICNHWSNTVCPLQFSFVSASFPCSSSSRPLSHDWRQWTDPLCKIDRVASFQGGNAEHDATTKYLQIRSPPSVEDGEEGLSDDSAGNSALEEFKRSPQSGEGGEEGSPDDSAGNSALEEFKRSPQSAEGGEEGLSEDSARISVLLEFER